MVSLVGAMVTTVGYAAEPIPLTEIPISNGMSLLTAQIAMSDSHIVVMVPGASPGPIQYTLHTFAIDANGHLESQCKQAVAAGRGTVPVLEGSHVFVGMPAADTPGTAGPVQLTDRGDAPWAQDRVVTGAGVVREFAIGSACLTEVAIWQAPKPSTFSGFGTKVAVSPQFLGVTAASSLMGQSLYLYPRDPSRAKEVQVLEGSTSTGAVGSAFAFTNEGLIFTEYARSSTRLASYSFSSVGPKRLGVIPDPDPTAPGSFGSEIEASGEHLLVVNAGPGAGGDGPHGPPSVDLFSRVRANWIWGKRILIDAPLAAYGNMRTAALSARGAYTVSSSGLKEWSESDGHWNLVGEIHAEEFAPHLQIHSIATHAQRMALLVQSTPDTQAPHLFLAVRNVSDSR